MKLLQRVVASGQRMRGYIYVNNRFEGSALQTIAALVDTATASPPD